jgi:hypothetical protein
VMVGVSAPNTGSAAPNARAKTSLFIAISVYCVDSVADSGILSGAWGCHPIDTRTG